MRGIAFLLTSLIVLMAVAVPGSALAYDYDGVAVVEAGGHQVLMNFTVEVVPSATEMADAGSLQYLVYLAEGTEQVQFDVLLLNVTEYEKYLAGNDFTCVANASSLGAGATPASVYHAFIEEGSYVLLVDNSDAGSVQNASAELMVNFEIVVENVDVQSETQWLPFILLMVFICVIGVLFLVVLNIALNYRLKKKLEEISQRCPNCKGTLPDYGKFCPHCGKEK
ncbi:MAG: zinc ribbon domain-containing protein [Methanomassiliicoccales archaeon]|nr:zinc ribbon domain-containing protein [Methanomassiliicoccales archaeon]